MSETNLFSGSGEFVFDSGQARLHGRLTLPTTYSSLVVLAHAGATPLAHDEALAVILQHAQIGTLCVDLLARGEERFADLHHNVALLARRLLDGLTALKQRVLQGELPPLPIGLCAFDDCSPVAVRVAALRDHDIFAVVCRGGLIDLAGMLYLRSLVSPLLVLVDEDDERLLASNRRALREVRCRQALQLVPTRADSPQAAISFAYIAGETVRWLREQLPGQAAALS